MAIPWKGADPIVVDVRSGERIGVIPVPDGTQLFGAAIDESRPRLALAERDGGIGILPLEGAGPAVLRNADSAYRLAWTPTGQLIVGTDAKRRGAIEGWDPTLATSVVIDSLATFCDALAVAPGGSAVATADPNTLHVTPISPRGLPRPTGPTRTLPVDQAFGKIAVIAWSPDGDRMALGSGSGNVSIIDAATGRVEHVLRAHRVAVVSLAWSADGRVLISADSDTVHLSDTTTAVTLDTLAPGFAVRSVLVTGPADAPDRWLVIGGEGRPAASQADASNASTILNVVDVGR